MAPALVLGPMLRHVGERDATVWVETDGACEVEVLGASARTFCVDGHHYALVHVEGLEPGQRHPYTVTLDGDPAWPPADSELPAPSIPTIAVDRELRLVFGSCRVALPHDAPWALHQADHPVAQGVDALRTLALRMVGSSPSSWPDQLLMLGDQVYADDLSPAMKARTAERGEPYDAPFDELATFDEYAAAYAEAWGEPLVRWLLASVPTAMIFDDHEISAQWKLSRDWMDGLRATSWYEDRIAAGLSAYWVYQHLGNLPPGELEELELLALVHAEADAGDLLRGEMRDADRQPGHSRWSFARQLGRTRLVVIDSRAGRVLDPGGRMMVDGGEWRWIEEQANGDHDHLLLASSVPCVLSPGLHHLEEWTELLVEGAWGGLVARLAERVRQAGVFDHWASFPQSFRSLATLLEEVATGRRGPPPASVVMLSGDVHHCYLAEVGFPVGTGATSSVWQAVCSAYRKDLAPKEKRAMRLGNSTFAARVTRALAAAAGAQPPPIGWRFERDPSYDNQVATLTLSRRSVHLRVETTAGCDWRDPRLRTTFEHSLTGPPEAMNQAFERTRKPSLPARS